MQTGKIVEARKDGVNYIHVVVVVGGEHDQNFPRYKKGWLIAMLTDVSIADPQVGQAVKFDVHTDDSGSKSAVNVVAA